MLEVLGIAPDLKGLDGAEMDKPAGKALTKSHKGLLVRTLRCGLDGLLLSIQLTSPSRLLY